MEQGMRTRMGSPAIVIVNNYLNLYKEVKKITKCHKCGRDLGKVGEIAVGAVDPNQQLPPGKNTYWCENRDCENYQIVGEIVNNRFIPL